MAHYHNRPSVRQLRKLGITQREFADRVKQTRERNNLTQQQMANELGVALQTIYAWQNMLQLPQKGLDPEFVLEMLDLIDQKYRGAGVE